MPRHSFLDALMSHFFQPPDCTTQYRAIGLVRGQYLPSLKAFNNGVLLTDDGSKFPAVMIERLARQLQKHPERLNAQHFWSVWPKPLSVGPGFWFEINGLRSSQNEHKQARLNADVNYFSVRGVVVFQDAGAGKLAIRIERNRLNRQGMEQNEHLEPFDLEIEGFLPSQAVGQFWELDCCRDYDRLVMEDAHLVAESPPRLLEKQIEAETQRRDSDSPKRTKAALKSGTKKANAPEPNLPALYREEEIMSTPGKMELTIKINQFPVEVKTVANGWKQFNVETGGQIVSIVVKPKVFKKLEQAQEQYPQFVAAISGQMGERTERGFILKEPNIQVFERKPKESKESKEPLEPQEFSEPKEPLEPKDSSEPDEPKEATTTSTPQRAATTSTPQRAATPRLVAIKKTKQH